MTAPFTKSPPAQLPGTGPGESCSWCGSDDFKKRSSRIRAYRTFTGSIYAASEIEVEIEETTWECANRDCRRMMQTERQLGWKTV